MPRVIVRSIWTERGSTLVEVLVASALLVTLVAGMAYLFVWSQRHALMAERLTTAMLVAEDRIQRLRAEPLSWSVSGAAVDAPTLAPSPPGALATDTTGYSDAVDRAGRPVEDEEADGPALVRRWAIQPARSSDPDGLAIEVCVFQAPVVAGAVPLVCLHTIRARQP